MAIPTYSINTPTRDAISYVNIYDILSLLPDNTYNLISPRDVRDAIFSSWENSVFRFTSNSSNTNYIGFDRDEVVNYPIYFGKKSNNGVEVLNNSVIYSPSNEGTDIFFSSTKDDDSDFKMTFLVGDELGNSPYIKVYSVLGSTSSVNVLISHNQDFGGDINIKAGDYGRVGVNGIIFPSTTEIDDMISSPISSSSGDMYLVRNSTGMITLRTGISLGNSLGTIGSDTFIYGNVYLNDQPLEFSNSEPMVDSFRGFAIGTTFSNVPIIEMLKGILYPYLKPLVSLTILNPVIERREDVNSVISLNYTLIKRSNDISGSSLVISGNSTIATIPMGDLSGIGYQTITSGYNYTLNKSNVLSNTSGVFNFELSAYDGQSSDIVTKTLNIVYPIFYGFSNDNNMSNIQNIIDDLTKLVEIKSDKELPLLGDDKYLYFCYPASYGNLSEIYDSNGYLIYQDGVISTTWISSNVNIQSNEGKWSLVTYKVYRTVNKVTIPSLQQYKFKF